MNVLITGLGAVSVAGVGCALTAEALSNQPPAEPADSVGELDLAGHLKAAKTYLDRNSQLALLSASMAMDDAGLLPPDESLNVGVSFGTAFGNVGTTETFLKMLAQKGPKLASPLLFIHSYPNTSSSLIAIEWTLTGPALNFCTGSSAGVDAIIAAAETVTDGKADVMLTGAAEAGGELLRTCLPGMAFRESAGMFTLETEATALGREAVIYAHLVAWTQGSDLSECIREVTEQAGLTADEIDLVVLDGTDPPAEIPQEKCLDLHRYTGQTFSAGTPLALITAAMRIESDEQVRNALVLTSGIDEAAFLLRQHEQS